ncbi:signal peptidase I [Terracidiphilus gabretensis]|uniref:signal peptidase I n=1 Tax=Terracidiphilus gabretensis TaxID=1577687 RepID=UPI00071BEDEE|nr:signal peptidase I [Terracidiphilus gabretensis]
MSAPASIRTQPPLPHAHRLLLPTPSDAFALLLRTLVVGLFLLTFLLQPYLIPSESMERTLLIGDFLLVNKQILAPSDALSRTLLPYREVQRGDIVVFHHPRPPLLIKRVAGIPGDHIRVDDGHLSVNGLRIFEPWAAFEPTSYNPARDVFPGTVYSDPNVSPDWWHKLPTLVQNGELVVPPGQYFVLGDNRNHSEDSRFWGLVPRDAIIARPMLIYFSVRRPSSTDVEQPSDDKLGHDRELTAKLTGFARWERIFRVVR